MKLIGWLILIGYLLLWGIFFYFALDTYSNVYVYDNSGHIIKTYTNERNVQVSRGDISFFHNGLEVNITEPTIVEQVPDPK